VHGKKLHDILLLDFVLKNNNIANFGHFFEMEVNMTINLILIDKVWQKHTSKYSKQQWEEHAIRALFDYSQKHTKKPP
jgi:hypothetical protein